MSTFMSHKCLPLCELHVTYSFPLMSYLCHIYVDIYVHIDVT